MATGPTPQTDTPPARTRPSRKPWGRHLAPTDPGAARRERIRTERRAARALNRDTQPDGYKPRTDYTTQDRWDWHPPFEHSFAEKLFRYRLYVSDRRCVVLLTLAVLAAPVTLLTRYDTWTPPEREPVPGEDVLTLGPPTTQNPGEDGFAFQNPEVKRVTLNDQPAIVRFDLSGLDRNQVAWLPVDLTAQPGSAFTVSVKAEGRLGPWVTVAIDRCASPWVRERQLLTCPNAGFEFLVADTKPDAWAPETLTANPDNPVNHLGVRVITATDTPNGDPVGSAVTLTFTPAADTTIPAATTTTSPPAN